MANRVDTDKIHGADKRRLELRDKVMLARDCSADWGEFYSRLARIGIRLMFRYNNVSRKLMGVTFKEGKLSYSGKEQTHPDYVVLTMHLRKTHQENPPRKLRGKKGY